MVRGAGGWFRWASVACGSLLLVGAGPVQAASPVGVELTFAGPHAVRVRVAEGPATPCDSGENHLLVNGKFEPGQVVRSSTANDCVCVQQTYYPFPDIDWQPAGFVCRPMKCVGFGKGRVCRPAPDPTIRVKISSDRPE